MRTKKAVIKLRDAQVALSLRFTHMSEAMFTHVALRLE